MLHQDATHMLRRTSHVATVLRRCTGATVLRSVGLDLSATSDASPIGKCDEFVLRSFKDGAKVHPPGPQSVSCWQRMRQSWNLAPQHLVNTALSPPPRSSTRITAAMPISAVSFCLPAFVRVRA